MDMHKDSKLYRWAYFFSNVKPNQTTLCAFFWRAFVFVPLGWAGLTCIVSLITFGLYKFTVTTYGAGPLAVIMFVTACVFTYNKRVKLWSAAKASELEHKLVHSVFYQGVKSIKSKLCPVIRFKGMA